MALSRSSTATPMWSMRSNTPGRLLDPFEAGIWPVGASDFRDRLAVDQDDVGGEVVLPTQERRADAVGVDRHLASLELADPLRGEAARDDDLDALVTRVVKRLAYLANQHVVHAGRREVAHLVPEGAVHQLLGGVDADSPEVVADGVRDLDRGPHRGVVEVDKHGHVHLVRVLPRPGLRRLDGVATERRDQRVRDGPDGAPAPPRRLRVGRDADRAGDVRGPLGAGL